MQSVEPLLHQVMGGDRSFTAYDDMAETTARITSQPLLETVMAPPSPPHREIAIIERPEQRQEMAPIVEYSNIGPFAPLPRDILNALTYSSNKMGLHRTLTVAGIVVEQKAATMTSDQVKTAQTVLPSFSACLRHYVDTCVEESAKIRTIATCPG